jgi:hypothetical protein
MARRSIGPLVARTDKGGLAAWIEKAEIGGEQQLSVVPLGADGAPLEPHAVATNVPPEPTSLVVRATGGARSGWLVAYSALLDRGESLTVEGFAPDGKARAKAADVQRTSDHIRWAEIVPTKSGALCVWVEEPPSGDANVLVAPLDTDGKPLAAPARVARGVEGWAVAPAEDGVALALISRPRESGAGAGAGPGVLSWLRLGADGSPVSAPLPIGTSPTVSGAVELVPLGGRWLLSWTDRTGEDAQVMLASVDPAGHVEGPRRAMDTVGGSVLLAMASGKAGTALAWEAPRGRARARRIVHLATVSPDGLAASPMSALELSPTGPLELSATGTGFAILASAAHCASAERCDGDDIPSFVRFDARLQPVQTEELIVGDVPGVRVASTLGWALSCNGDRCSALAATSEAPAPIYALDLPSRVSPFFPPLSQPPPPDAPRVTGVATIASGLPFADVSAARLGDVSLVASLTTAVDPHETGSKGGNQAGSLVSVRGFNENGQPVGRPVTLSSRAVSVGGVALAVGDERDRAAIAWVDHEAGGPQLQLAKLDGEGRVEKRASFSASRGNVSSVALAGARDGWLAAWVDGRNGNGEVYAVRVDRSLTPVGRAERITHAPGDASDVSLAVQGEMAWLAWSDPRESPREGVADIYVTTIRTRDAARLTGDVRVLATAAHSRSPQIVALGNEAVVAWIEDSPGEIDGSGSAMVARVSAEGRVIGPPAKLPLAGEGRPVSVALVASGDVLHAVVTRAVRGELTLDAVVLAADAAVSPRPWALLDLDAPAAFDVAVALTGDTAFYDDSGRTPGSHRIRRAQLAWHR